MDQDMKNLKLKWCPECQHVTIENEVDECSVCQTKLIYPVPPYIAPLLR